MIPTPPAVPTASQGRWSDVSVIVVSRVILHEQSGKARTVLHVAGIMQSSISPAPSNLASSLREKEGQTVLVQSPLVVKGGRGSTEMRLRLTLYS